MSRLPIYFWRGRPNFGDLLSPLLLKHFCGIEAVWVPVEEASLVGVGSIIEHIPNGWNGKIVGAGKLHEESLLPVDAKIVALRGPLTAKGVRGDFAIGDLGLLANELVRVETKKWKLGIVPHWSDTQLATDPRFAPSAAGITEDPLIIDPRGDPLDVIRLIGECIKIVSSSLHGIILADAFGIPRRAEYAPRLDVEGGDFKFRDYSESIRTSFEIGALTQGNRQAIDDRKSELYDVLRSLA
jgi:hypothetical protein